MILKFMFVRICFILFESRVLVSFVFVERWVGLWWGGGELERKVRRATGLLFFKKEVMEGIYIFFKI